MTWDRTTVAELNAWETELGNEGWNWENLYAAMLKVETFLPSDKYGNEGVGSNGPIRTLINRIFPKHQFSWIPTLNNLGLATNRESLNGNNIGVSDQPSNVSPDYRRSYAPEYLKLASDNLSLKLDTRVAKVNFEGTTATGVTLEDGTVITAKQEVILSAGSFQTPGLLELSGIGNATLLKELGIPVVKDLPSVGENLQDHIRIQSTYQLKPEYPSFDALKNKTIAAAQQILYDAGEVSLYDYTASGYAYFPWSTISNDTEAKMRSLISPSTSSTDKLKALYMTPPLSTTVPQLEVIFSDGYTGVKGYPTNSTTLRTFALIGVIQHPHSTGHVHITTRNITSPPAINPNYLTHPYDLAAATTLAKYLRRIASTEPMGGIWSQEYEPGMSVNTDAEWEVYAKRNTLSIYHPVGTAAMLPERDGGVVDSMLRVYGTRGLRVVDASVVPLLPSAHLQTLVYGIAERAAGMLVEEYS
jgi:choline dehydrogenase-like flavoprotein